MNLLFALVFHFSISLVSCRNIKYIELDPNKDIFHEQSLSSERDNQEIILNKLRFLKVLQLNKELENTIDGHILEPETRYKNSAPFAIIVATADDNNLDQFEKSELKPTPVEELVTVGEEPKDMLNIQVEEDVSHHESKLHNYNESGMTLKTIAEQIGEVLYHMNTTSSTGEDNYSMNNSELKSSKPQVEDEINYEIKLENVMMQNNDAEMRKLMTDTSKEKLKNEEALHHKDDTEFMHALFEVENDTKSTTALNPELCEDSKQRGSSNEVNINKTEDDLKLYKISLVLNKYVFVK